MKAPVNLALFPAFARRRARWVLAASILVVGTLTALHASWANSGPDASSMRAETARLAGEQRVWQERLDEIRAELEERRVRDLGDQVDLVNGMILERAADPVEVLELLERTAPESVVVQQLTLTRPAEGAWVEVTLLAPSQAPVMELIRALNQSSSVHELSPVREVAAQGGTQVALSFIFGRGVPAGGTGEHPDD